MSLIEVLSAGRFVSFGWNSGLRCWVVQVLWLKLTRQKLGTENITGGVGWTVFGFLAVMNAVLDGLF